MKDRNYGIDLLRIVTMFMIVNLHVFWYGGILRSENLYFLSAKYNIVWILEIICYVAVNCYALISGFVGIESRYKYSNIVLLWLRVVFYSISLYLIGCIFGIVDFNFNTLITFCFPVVNSKYWYFTAYFCLFFFMPILNSALENMEHNYPDYNCNICTTFYLFRGYFPYKKWFKFCMANGSILNWWLYQKIQFA